MLQQHQAARLSCGKLCETIPDLENIDPSTCWNLLVASSASQSVILTISKAQHCFDQISRILEATGRLPPTMAALALLATFPPATPSAPSTNSSNLVADPSPKPIRTPKKKERANKMLSPKLASDGRRKAHRRQNSTPTSVAPYQARPLPAALKRVNSKKATPTHRRGLSLDHSSFRQPAILTQTLGPISQDDATVSITDSQQHLQFAQQHELVQPGQNQYQQLQELHTNFTFPTQEQQMSPNVDQAPQFQADQVSPHTISISQFQPQQMAANTQRMSNISSSFNAPATAYMYPSPPGEAPVCFNLGAYACPSGPGDCYQPFSNSMVPIWAPGLQTEFSTASVPHMSPFEQQLDLQQPLTPSPQPTQHQFFPPTPQTHHTQISPQISSQATFQSQMAPPMEPVLSQQGPPSPSKQQIDDLREHVEAIYGKGVSVTITGILPTPVATPSKRPSITSPEKIDASPIPFNLNEAPQIELTPIAAGGVVNVFTDMERTTSGHGYESSAYSPQHMSPTQSFHGSPQMMAETAFSTTITSNEMSFTDGLNTFIASSPSILADVEVSSPPCSDHQHGSPSRTPRSMSLADLNINGSVKPTGIDPGLIHTYMSEQDPVTHKWKCLYPGCRHSQFGRRENIRAHIQTHLGDRQYQCNTCKKRFVRQHDLKRHSKIHMGVKDYVCACGSTFARMDALTRHRQRGMCRGGFPGAVRQEKKRGRPRKNNRPDMDARVNKADQQRRRNARRGTENSDNSDYASAASTPSSLSVSSPSPNLNQTEFASLDAVSGIPSSPPAESLLMPLVTSSISPSSLNASASGSVGAADATIDFSTLVSTEPDVSTATNMERTVSDSAESYTTIFNSPNWESELLKAAANNADANTNLWSVPSFPTFEDTFSLDDIPMDYPFPSENEDRPSTTRCDSMSTTHKATFLGLFENNPSCGSLDSYFDLDSFS